LYLIDTVVLSELRRRQRDAGVVAWMAQQHQEDCYLSVVSLGEIERGIAGKRASDPRFAEDLAAWLDRLLRLHGQRLLAVDLAIARRWGRLSAALGHDSADLLIAATALERGLTVVTRNMADFKRFDVPLLNPFQT
jgi:predicted nucleic acid-binding protein